MEERVAIDLEAYAQRVLRGPCFVCAALRGDPDDEHPIAYEDEVCAAFLARYPTLLGYTLVVPKAHVTDVSADRPLYRHLTDVVRDVAEALKTVVPTERVYLLSLGSMQGNAHVHWHVAPLRPVPFRQQQFHALEIANGVLPVTADGQRALAARLRVAIAARRGDSVAP